MSQELAQRPRRPHCTRTIAQPRLTPPVLESPKQMTAENRQLQICDVVLVKQIKSVRDWVAPVKDGPGKLQTHRLPNLESTRPGGNPGTPKHDALTQIHDINRCEVPVKFPTNGPIVDRGNVDSPDIERSGLHRGRTRAAPEALPPNSIAQAKRHQSQRMLLICLSYLYG